ncbi:hypothetical protein [Escherichia coli]|uniref:hypothetical protein n=1 Tax=Escherichia coli TaxID=562 RepID=UPI000BE32E4B|nr:hypothetical protein [Escherichia coli]
MGLEMIIGLIVAALAAIAGAFGLGKSRGTSIAETKADRMGYESLDKDEQAAINLPASMIRLLKQREGEGWIGDIGANFDSRSHQFLEGEKKPFNYQVGKPQSEFDLEWEASNVTRV